MVNIEISNFNIQDCLFNLHSIFRKLNTLDCDLHAINKIFATVRIPSSGVDPFPL